MKISGLTVLFLISLLANASVLFGDDENYFIEAIRITGNRRTRESYIRSFITLEEGKQYELQDLLKAIGSSKDNLEKTGLFSNVLVDDQADEESRLTLTFQVSERGYFHLRPSGFLRYQGGELVSRGGLAFSSENLFGNGSKLALDFPIYDEAGFRADFQSRSKRITYGFSTEYYYAIPEEEDWYSFGPSMALELGEKLSLGLQTKLNGNDFTSLIFNPFLESGTEERPSRKAKRWHHIYFSPYLGANFTGSSLYGLDTELGLYWDLLLQIVFATAVEFDAQGGTIPENIKLTSPVRGNRYGTLKGNVLISTANELRIPVPWNTNIVLVPFFDAAFMGGNTLVPYLGGGIGLRWYTRLFNPLLIDLGFGRGITVNFDKRL